jgi:mono/diheme cytochrome c family protein
MSDHKPEKKVKPPKAFGWVAEYADENKLLDAARKVRDSGYSRTDAFTPFPVHGIDEALGIKPTVLPWFTLFAGATGTSIALLMQWWMNAYDYPYIISGKPFASWPAFIPVAFELTILFAAFTTVFAMLGLNGLPRFSNPMFTNPKFDRATDDRFFLWVDSRDKYFNTEKVKGLLESTGPLSVDEVREDESPADIPRGILTTIFALILVTLIPGAVVLRMRAAKSEDPRLHVFFDMDFQPKKKSQQTTTIFPDGRTQRMPVPGTVARGELDLADPYYLGYDPDQTAGVIKASDLKMVSFLQEDVNVQTPDDGDSPAPQAKTPAKADANQAEAQPAPATDKPADETPVATEATETPAAEPASANAPSETPQAAAVTEVAEVDEVAPASAAPADSAAPAAGAPAGEPNYAWLTEFPLPVDDELFQLGRKKYEINCATCHGFGGYGDGLVSQRAANFGQGYWLQPTSVHDQRIQEQPIGRIYYTVANGKGKMAGYASSLTPRERWAVVLYVKALQRSQNATLDDVPEARRTELTTTTQK